MFVYKRVLFIFFIITLSSCSSNKKQEVVREDSNLLAKVGEKKLYISDLPKFIFTNRNEKDSFEILDLFIDKWIQDEVFAQKASEIIHNIDEINIETDNYKRELIINSYEKELLNNIDADLTEEELKDYYEKNKEFFVFDEPYFEIKYIRLPKNTQNLAKIKKAISKGENSHWIMNYCNKNPSKCFIENNAVKKSLFLKEKLHLNLSQQKVSSKFRYQYIGSDEVMIYKIVKVYKKGDIAPFQIVKKEVTRLALHNKKQKHLQFIKEKTYQKAKDDEIFEKYIN